MRITLELDDALIESAKEYTGIEDDRTVVEAALTAIVQREAARRLARLGGTEPDLKPIRRRRAPMK